MDKEGLENGLANRDDRWSEAIAVGSRSFVDKVKSELGFKAAHRDVIEGDESYALREPSEAYACKFAAVNAALRTENTFLWDETVDEATIELGPTRNICDKSGASGRGMSRPTMS
jgi:hypothetical protein